MAIADGGCRHDDGPSSVGGILGSSFSFVAEAGAREGVGELTARGHPAKLGGASATRDGQTESRHDGQAKEQNKKGPNKKIYGLETGWMVGGQAGQGGEMRGGAIDAVR